MDVEVGSRVTYGSSGKTGTVRYVGEVDSLSGEWAGIELDKPEGKHNGELNGRVYFTCPANHGVFVKKAQLKLLNAARSGATASPSVRTAGPARLTPSAPSAAAAASTTASRLQQMRDRRASGIGLGGAASGTRGSASATSSTNTLGVRDSRLSLGGTTGPLVGAGSTLRRTPSSSSSTTSSSATSRPTTDTSARRLSMGRTTPPPSTSGSASSAAALEELMEAKGRIAKLEDDLEDRNRLVEQLKQDIEAMREASESAATVEPSQVGTAEDAPMGDAMEVDESGSNDESSWLEKIAAIREQAEEHVRIVRAELEEHIAQLQSEHEELVDELRLENATQGSEIKALEAEVAQQKVRIAQFASAEQKKAEDVALAMAKTSAGARKVDALEAQINEFQEMIETLTLEKETLEMDKEIAEERVEELAAEVEKLKTSVALATSTAHSGATGDLAEENMKLRAAVKALHDRSSEEKNDLNKKLRQLQRENSELHNLREEVEHLTARKNVLEGEVEELKELLDVANAYESMVEDLTEKNLTLGEKVAELEASVSTLESLKELSEEVEHQQNEYVAELTSKIETQQARIQELKNVIAEQRTVVEDKDRTIARFRDATNRTREDMNQLKAQLRAEAGELETLKGTTHSALSQTMTLRALAASARENEAEAAKQRINADQARLENAFLRAAIPISLFSETDQKVLRIRLSLGRIAGKSDILLQYMRKDLDAIAQQDPSEGSSLSVVDSERIIQQLLLGERLSRVSCGAREDLFVLECHLTTAEEYSEICSRLDSSQMSSLESALDGAFAGLADSTLFVSRSGEASAYNRLLSSAEEWNTIRLSVRGPRESDGLSTRCAAVKLRSKQSVWRLAFSFAEMLTFVRTLKTVMTSSEATLSENVTEALVPVFDRLTEEYLALLKLTQHLHRRADIDLAWSDEDLDGSIAAGGEVVELLSGFADECQNLWSVLQTKMSVASVQTISPDEIALFAENSLLVSLSSLKERLATVFKSVCRGSFIDAASSRERTDLESSREGRPQWLIRAQAIQKELIDASSLQATLKETNELSQHLHARVRELERADSQHRVVTQKLESEILRLNDTLGQTTAENSRLEEQLAREREQFNVALDESHKDKAALDNANRELRKQLKRSSDIGLSSTAAASSGRGKPALNQAEADAFRKAFRHLHDELHKLRADLARERLDSKLGPVHSRRVQPTPSNPPELLLSCAKDVSLFARQVKSQLSMPRMVDLSQNLSARDQLTQKKLDHAKMMRTLSDLRARISMAIQEGGWNGDVVNAIGSGENIFGWRPPEMERPPVLLSRVTLQKPLGTSSGSSDHVMEDVDAPPVQPVQLLLNLSQTKLLTRTLAC